METPTIDEVPLSDTRRYEIEELIAALPARVTVRDSTVYNHTEVEVSYHRVPEEVYVLIPLVRPDVKFRREPFLPSCYLEIGLNLTVSYYLAKC